MKKWGAAIGIPIVVGLVIWSRLDTVPEVAPSQRPHATVAIIRATLVETLTARGELGYGPVTPLDSAAAGVVTWLPRDGAIIKRGEVLLRADDKPVVLLYGPLPMFRTLSVGMQGRDVRQLTSNMRSSKVPVSDTYTQATAVAIKRWQKRMKLPETGTIGRDQVVFAPGPIRVAEAKVRLGASATGEVLTYTATSKVVTVNASAGGAPWMKLGTTVQIRLPDGRLTPGKVSHLGTVVADDATMQVQIEVADQKALAKFEKSPVDVQFANQERRDVLTVPVTALLALAEGGYGLELVTAGQVRVIAVTPGLIADGRVEVTGASLVEGQLVGVPE